MVELEQQKKELLDIQRLEQQKKELLELLNDMKNDDKIRDEAIAWGKKRDEFEKNQKIYDEKIDKLIENFPSAISAGFSILIIALVCDNYDDSNKLFSFALILSNCISLLFTNTANAINSWLCLQGIMTFIGVFIICIKLNERFDNFILIWILNFTPLLVVICLKSKTEY